MFGLDPLIPPSADELSSPLLPPIEGPLPPNLNMRGINGQLVFSRHNPPSVIGHIHVNLPTIALLLLGSPTRPLPRFTPSLIHMSTQPHLGVELLSTQIAICNQPSEKYAAQLHYRSCMFQLTRQQLLHQPSASLPRP